MTDKGKAGKRTRYIKQVTDDRGRFTKKSKVIKGNAIYSQRFEEFDRLMVDSLKDFYQRHLAIRNWIIVVLIIINLLSWSH